jgi:[protein-PII] uridylyltransferase
MTYRGTETEPSPAEAGAEGLAVRFVREPRAGSTSDRPGDPDVAAFAASMPPEYRASYDHTAVAAHAAIVAARGDRSTYAAIWRELPKMTGICVVAENEPGLLSRVSAALVAHDVDVVSANAYTRPRADGSIEAVDLLWVRRAPNAAQATPIRARDVSAIGETVEALVSGRTSFGGAAPASVGAARGRVATCVTFEDHRDGTTVLTVEAVDRPGLLLAVTRTVFGAGLQIMGLRATTEEGRAIDRLHVAELDGAPLGSDRRLSLENAILAAVDGDRAER